MKLYKKENGKIKVYTLFPNEEEIIKYKKGEMNNIPKEEQVCKAVTRVGHYGYPVFLEHEDEFIHLHFLWMMLMVFIINF